MRAQHQSIGPFPQEFRPGDPVVVARSLSETEKDLVGRTFVFSRYTAPHGYAVVSDHAGSWHVHPECLEPTCGSLEAVVQSRIPPLQSMALNGTSTEIERVLPPGGSWPEGSRETYLERENEELARQRDELANALEAAVKRAPRDYQIGGLYKVALTGRQLEQIYAALRAAGRLP